MDGGCSSEDMPGPTDGWEGWRERERERGKFGCQRDWMRMMKYIRSRKFRGHNNKKKYRK